MAPRHKSRFWRRCRILFRHFRIGLWLVILLLLGGLLYLNQIGLPGIIKKPLLERLRARGVDLQFSRLRWRWDRGIVADNVHFGRPDDPASPKLNIKEVQVRLDYKALAHLQFQVRSLMLRDGNLAWPVIASNEPPRELTIDNIETELRLPPNDLWELDNFQAQFAGANFKLAGIVTNASAVRDWSIFHARQAATPGATQRRLRQIADTLEKIHFATPPEMRMDVRGDARELSSFRVQLVVNAPDADTPWGTFDGGHFSALLSPAPGNELSHAEIVLRANHANTRWGTVTNLDLTVHAMSPERGTNVVDANLDLAAEQIETKWGSATKARFTAQWLHSLNDPIPLSGRGSVQLDDAHTRWATARQLRFTATMQPSTNEPAIADASWDWWTNLAPYTLDWEATVNGLQATNLAADTLFCSGQWCAPDLHATRISAQLYGGNLDAQADLDVATRHLAFSASSDFDPHKIAPLLTPRSRYWISQYSWKKPPEVNAEGTLTLAPWTIRHPDWRGEVKPTVRLQGHFHVEDGAFRGVPAAVADSHFTYSNEVWRLPDLVITRPEGRLDMAHEEHERTGDYYFKVRSTIDVRALRPLLEPAQQRGLDLFTFTQPPLIDGEIWGRWSDHDRIGFNARVAVTNFTFRGESADALQTELEYTNRYLQFIEPRIERGTQHIAAAGLAADFNEWKAYLTNGFSTADPQVVTRAIGPHIGRTMEPYHFAQPPSVRAWGTIPLRHETDADLHFAVDGGPFGWWKFHVPHIAGDVDWVGERLALRNVVADFYQGKGAGNAEFKFSDDKPATFHFDADATDADLHSMMDDLATGTNRLEGKLTARLDVMQANTADWQSWQGQGRVDLRDGLIWQIPIFGIFSPVLDGISPGLGSSRVREGSATFAVTNGVIRSDDLELRASLMRLQYWGTVDMAGAVDARVQAELLRDTWVVGPVISLALWPVSKVFEYKVTGSLSAPKTEPVFLIPKIMLLPFHPLRTFKDLVPTQPGSGETNAPSAIQ